jgi:hypothetical protein
VNQVTQEGAVKERCVNEISVCVIGFSSAAVSCKRVGVSGAVLSRANE